MDDSYRAGLRQSIDAVFQGNPGIPDHRRRFPWLTGALGEPGAGIWFLAENPSLGQVERVQDPLGGPPTEEAQWCASRGDRLFRELLVRYGFKEAPLDAHGGWRCCITNLKRGSPSPERE